MSDLIHASLADVYYQKHQLAGINALQECDNKNLGLCFSAFNGSISVYMAV